MNKKGVKLTILFSLIAIFLVFSLTFAQERKLEIEYPEIFGLKPETIKTGLPEYAKYLFNFSVLIVGLILFGVLIWGGIRYLTSAGRPAKVSEAKERMTSAFFGAILLLFGYIILITINPQLAIFEIPPLKEPKICETEKDCPRGFECKEGKCVMRESCVKNEDCPYTYECKGGKCVKIEGVTTTHIFWEIPVGQMAEKGLWGKAQTTNLGALMIGFEQFLNQEIKTGSPSFKKISDLNKYLKNLTESCHCEELTAVCEKPKNGASPRGCVGDPCKKVRDRINKVVNINKKKSQELLAYKEKLTKAKNLFEEEGRKYRNLTRDIWAKCQERGLLTRGEYYASVAFVEKLGGTTKLERLYLPAKDDPLVFYCPVGGTIFDYPYTYKPEKISPELAPTQKFVPELVEVVEPLSCPAVIPVGELLDEIVIISYETNSSLEELIFYIDKMVAELTKMTQLISQCNRSRCTANCSCFPNPCYGICWLPTPLTPNPCFPFCKSPCLQAVGGCYGEPCPRQEIAETVNNIKTYEDEIFNLLGVIKEDIEDAQLYLKTNEKDKIDLDAIRGAIQTCLSFGAGTTITEKPEEESFWALLRCEMALGNKGPDGNTITDCHPMNFYCCSNRPTAKEIRKFPSAARKERTTVSTPLPEEPHLPTAVGYNNVPIFLQCDENWKKVNFGCGNSTICSSGCGPTSIAMALSFFGVKVDPPTVANWVLKNGYRVCGNGIAWNGICAAAKEFGKGSIKCEKYDYKVEELLEELGKDKNKIAIVSRKGPPPYTEGGHFIVLTGIEKRGNKEFVCYNDPFPNHKRPAQGCKEIDFFRYHGISAGRVLYKK